MLMQDTCQVMEFDIICCGGI